MGAFLLVLLKILQIIGIILLALLLLVLLLIFLVLFVPVRYRFSGKYKDGDYSLKASAGWLLNALILSFEMAKEKDTEFKIKLFGFNLNKEKKPSKRKKKDMCSEAEKETAAVKETFADKEIPSDNDTLIDTDVEEQSVLAEDKVDCETYENNNVEVIPEEKTLENDKKILSDYVEEDIEEEAEKKSSHKSASKMKKKDKKDSKDSSKYDKIKSYIEIIQSERFKQAFELCKKNILKLIKALLPRKFKAVLNLAFSDPEKYGKAMAAYGMLFAVLYKNVDFNCIPEEDYIDVTAKGKGHIYGITALVVFIRIYFNKNIRKLIKMFKAEEE